MKYTVTRMKVDFGDKNLWAVVDEHGHTIIQIPSKGEHFFVNLDDIFLKIAPKDIISAKLVDYSISFMPQ